MKWHFAGFGTKWRSRRSCGHEPQLYILAYRKWILKWGSWTIWTWWEELEEIPIWQWAARAPIGDPVITPEQRERWTP